MESKLEIFLFSLSLASFRIFFSAANISKQINFATKNGENAFDFRRRQLWNEAKRQTNSELILAASICGEIDLEIA